MKIKKWDKKVLAKEYTVNSDEIPNRYSIKCATSAIAIVLAIWILNRFNIFTVDKTTMTTCLLACLVVYAVGRVLFLKFDMKKPSTKYFVLLWLTMIVSIMTTLMTFHAILACVLPIICSTMYCKKRVSFYTLGLTVVSMYFTVMVGYYYGICDANMVLLPGEPMAAYLDANNGFLLTYVNDSPEWTLPLFFVLPRCIICAGFAMVCNTISGIISINYNYAAHMKDLAEIDGMTELYNRSKYLDMMNGKYTNVQEIGVIFWDINFLKCINDTKGHEEGDKLIKAVSDSIRQVAGAQDMPYRVGGDEFVMIMCDVGEKEVLERIKKWKGILDGINKQKGINASVSVGYACGEGKDIAEVIKKADEKMYEDKCRCHEKAGIEVR